MDIFKLFFEHDLRLDQLDQRNTGDSPRTGASIEDFMKPDPTYSRFYFTGSRLVDEKFGLNVLENYSEIEQKLDRIFEDFDMVSSNGHHSKLSEAIEKNAIGEAIFISKNEEHSKDPSSLRIGDDSNIGHFKTELKEVLSEGIKVLYKETAHDGFDLHLFSRKNMYEHFFYPIKELVNDSFRFFSINSKRVRSERQFYFETWTLEKPPHGAEEVHRETVL